MNDNEDSGSLIPVQEICRELLGQRVAPATIWRWLRRGAHGAILQGVYVRGRWHTTRENFQNFLQQQTENRLAADQLDASVKESNDERLRQMGLL